MFFSLVTNLNFAVKMMIDTYRDKGLRAQLVKELRLMGISDELVLEAMNKIPRHWFLDRAFLEFAYDNKAFQIGAGQTISAPYTVAFQSQLLEVKRGEKILEIGTGSGYQTSVLVEMGAKVYSIERQKLLFENAKKMFQQLNYRPHTFYGDGYKGKKGYAPFDKVIVTCGAPFVPEDLLHQMKIGGKMIIPLGEGKMQTMTEIVKKSETEFTKIDHGDFSFVPMLEKREYRKY